MSIHQTFNYGRSNITSAPESYPLLNPTVLFTSGQRGFWYEANDSTTLWQDSSQTIQVNSTTQNVNAWSDKSGNNFDVTSRVLNSGSVGLIYEIDGDGKDCINFDKGYIQYDGGLNSWTNSGQTAITMFFAVQPTSTETRGLFRATPRAFNYVDLSLYSQYTATGPQVFYDNISDTVRVDDSNSIANVKSVITVTWRYDLPNPIKVWRINGVDKLPTATVTGTNATNATFNQSTIRIGGSMTSSYYKGLYYGAVGVVGELDIATISGIEQYMAQIIGITL